MRMEETYDLVSTPPRDERMGSSVQLVFMIFSRNRWKLAYGSGFVKKSAGFSAVGT